MSTHDVVQSWLSMRKKIRTQDNHITKDPIFFVQGRLRIYGMDLEFSEGQVWMNSEDEREADADEVAELESAVAPPWSSKWSKVGFCDVWENLQPFFTEEGAQEYLQGAHTHHHHAEFRIYVDSAHRNSEWRTVRGLLLGNQP